jgi:hypothetical protein
VAREAMSNFYHIKEVILAMGEKVDVTFRGQIIGIEFDRHWKNASGKEYVFNTMYVMSPKGGRVPISLTDAQCPAHAEDVKTYDGKVVTVVCEANFYKSSARFSLISITK